MPSSRTRAALAAAVLSGMVLVATLLFRVTPPEDAPPAGPGPSPSAPAPPAITGPPAPEVRAAIDRAVSWLDPNSIHPTAGGLSDFRLFALELRAWHLLYVYERDPDKRDRYRRSIRDRLAPLAGGDHLVALYEGARVPKYIAELLVVLPIAREVGYPLPAVERRLVDLIEQGLDAPARPAPLRIALAYLIRQVGLDLGPSVSDLMPGGLASIAPREEQMGLLDVYLLTHEVFGVSDYGLGPPELAPAARDYLRRTIPSLTKSHRLAGRTDIEAELLICCQVLGLTRSDEYGDGIRFLIECQSPDGYFVEPAKGDPSASLRPADRMHLAHVAIQALLGHEALVLGTGLPGWRTSAGEAPRDSGRTASRAG